MAEVLRTPDARFTDLPDFPFARHEVEDLPDYSGLRMAYVDEGSQKGGTTFLCVHGQPTWSYLYRHMIPVFTAAGHRTVAPDLFGFGRSDKPVDETVYTFDFHRDALLAFIRHLRLDRLVLVLHDWGGMLGLTLPMELDDRVTAMVITNTALATGDAPLPKGFLAWRAWAARNPDMAVGSLLGRSCPHLTAAEQAAYDAPFLDVRYKAGVRRFPQLVPERPEEQGAALSRRARNWLRDTWSGASFMAIGMQDPVLGPPIMEGLRSVIAGCPEPMLLEDAGHFVPEWGEAVARRALTVLEPCLA